MTHRAIKGATGIQLLRYRRQGLGAVRAEGLGGLGPGEDAVGMDQGCVRTHRERLRGDPNAHVGLLEGLVVLVQQDQPNSK